MLMLTHLSCTNPGILQGSQQISPIPVAARSKAWVCSRLLAGIVGSNPDEGMAACLLWVLCVVR